MATLLERRSASAARSEPPLEVRRRPSADRFAVALLMALPLAIFGVPALLGHPVLPGDDLAQNYPLRVLASHQLSHGQLPLYDPYIWSGAPLLAGWNAGAAYPFTVLFAVLPLSESRSRASRLRWIAALGDAFAMTILAGEPRAIDDARVLIAIY